MERKDKETKDLPVGISSRVVGSVVVGLVGVGRVGGGSVVGVDVVLVDGVSGVSRVDSSGVVNERSGGLVSGRSSSGVDVGRSHGRDGSEVLLTSGASLAGSSEADGDGSVKLATGSSDDEPDTGREVKMGVGESEVVNTVSGYDEESEVKLNFRKKEVSVYFRLEARKISTW